MDPLAPIVLRKFVQKQAAQYAYHGTKAAVLPNIARRGLIVGGFSSFGDSYSEFDDGRHLFFADDPEYVREAYGDVILRFPWPADAIQDQNKYGRYLPHQFVSKHSVTPDKIEFERDGKWEPLVSKRVTYTGVFIDESSHEALLDWWALRTNTPLHSKVWAHHMTIKFAPTAEEVAATPVGKKVTLHVIGWAADEKGQAVLVEPQGIESANRHPHVTISTAPGTGPVYSNELLAKGVNRVSGPTLNGTVDART